MIFPFASSRHVVPARTSESSRVHPTERSLLTVLSLGAAAIHFGAAPDHFAEYWLFGLAFTVVAWFQAIWAAIWVYVARPPRSMAILAVLVNAATIGVWLWSRTVGLPIGATPGVPEPLGPADAIADILELALIAGVVVTTWLPPGSAPLRAERRALHILRTLATVAAIVATGYALASLAPSMSGMG